MKYEQPLLAGALLFMVLVGGSDAGRYIIAIRIGLALLGSVIVLVYLLRAGAQHDVIDKLALCALIVFLVACVLSSMPRASFDAATTAIAFTAAFYVARGAAADKSGRRLTTSALGLAGCVFSAFFLVLWGGIWLRWIQLSGTPPPFDLALPAPLYRHQYLVGMLAALLLPATVQLARRPVIWPLGVIGTLASVAVAIMSGSRTVWLGGILALLVCVVLTGRRNLPRLTWRWTLAGLLSVSVLVVVAGPILNRLAAGSTVASRLGIWDASVRHWLESPVLGFGPGTFARELVLSGYYQTHEGLVPHGHNAIVQLVLEAGLLGVLIVVLVGSIIVIALRRGVAYSIAPIAGVTFFAGASLTDNPTVVPYLVMPAIMWAAIAVPRYSLEPIVTSSWIRVACLGTAAIVGAACAVILAAALTYESATPAARAGDAVAVADRLSTANQLDPGNALYRRDLAVWDLAAGRLDEADSSATDAVRLNPADDTAWRVAAIVALERGDFSVAEGSARRASQLRGSDPLNQLTVAYVAQRVGDQAARETALTTALQWAPWVAATNDWQANFGDATVASLRAAVERPVTAEDPNVRAWAWLPAMAGIDSVTSNEDPVLAVASSVIACDLPKAAREIETLPRSEALTIEGLLGQVMLARASAADDSRLLVLAMLRYRPLAFIAELDVGGVSPLTGPGGDPLFYGRLSLPAPSIGPTLPISESGLSAWLRNPRAAAAVGAPQSGLARC